MYHRLVPLPPSLHGPQHHTCKISDCACTGNAGNSFPATNFKKEFQSGIVLTKKEFKHWLQVAGKCLYLCLCLCLVRLSAGNRVPSACAATLPVTILKRNVSLMSRRQSFRGAHLRSFKYDCTLEYWLKSCTTNRAALLCMASSGFLPVAGCPSLDADPKLLHNTPVETWLEIYRLVHAVSEDIGINSCGEGQGWSWSWMLSPEYVWTSVNLRLCWHPDIWLHSLVAR